MTIKKLIPLLVLLVVVTTVVIVTKEQKVAQPGDVISETQSTSTDIIINDTNDFYTITAELPREPKDTKDEMNKLFADIIKNKQEEWKIGGGLYIDEMKTRLDYPDRPVMKYELNIKYDRYESAKRDIVSYVFKSYEFTGGAHGGTGLFTFTFNKDGRLRIEQILNLTRENSIALTRILGERLKVSLGELYNEKFLSEGLGLAYIKEDGTFDKTKSDGFDFISNFENFVVTDEGITFIFSQYQVGPYAAGMPEVLLTWEELGDYLVQVPQ